MFHALVLLQTADPLASVLAYMPLVLVFVIFWFLVIGPARRKQKQLQATIAGLKKGDRVITQGGLYGEVAAVEPATVLLKIADGVKVKVSKAGIAGLAEGPESQQG